MAIEDTASVIPLHQSRKPKTAAERARAYRQRRRAKTSLPAVIPAEIIPPSPVPVMVADDQHLVTSRSVTSPSRRPLASYALIAAATGLGAVGLTINGWFARSLGSTDSAGWLFLAIGVAADLVALSLPSAASRLWEANQRTKALAGWSVWLMTFAFAVTAGIGFASVNITDVTASRASRITPAVTLARTSLDDAMAARDRECRGGVGKFCREREATVTDRRAVLDVEMAKVEQASDPQTEAATRIVTWVTHGFVKPTGDDFAMLRLVLLALLPQLGGVLLMLGRTN